PAPGPAPTTDFTPQKGQTITYTGQAYGAKQFETYVNQGFDTYYKEWTVTYKITTTYDRTGTSYNDSLWSTTDHKDRLATCVADGGKLETIDVIAGTFETCKIQESQRYVWYGNVPFWGYVKIQNLNGDYSSEVSSYSL
ncbi:MAG: hypothetical protein AAB250_08505, partial [Bdellovibrionota bacterium]